MVLYRKYRPQKLSELDSVEISSRLSKVLFSSYLPHAFLFAGPKGTGKTSSARIVAKILNCEKSRGNKNETDIQNAEPCNKCESCISITSSRHLDIIEIDAASNRGIEEIRDLKEKIKLSPISAKYKVYIIDEVHMLTNEAFNALLKTLEEPPSHAVFILATTEPDKLPGTIISRCIRFNFQKATPSEIRHSLERVIKGENIKIDQDILETISGFSEGSFRDATKILEQAISEKALTVEKLLTLFGRDNMTPEKFLLLLSDNKLKDALEYVELLAAKGADFRIFTTELLNLLHLLLLSFHGVREVELPKKIVEAINSSDKINTLIKLFSRVYVELKTASSPEIPLEIAVVQWCEKGGVYV